MSAASPVLPAFVGVHDGHNASVAVVRGGRLEFALQEERLTRIKNQGDAPLQAARAARGLVDAGGASVALNGHYMNYGQWSRDTVVRDYEASASLASRWKQPLKGTFVDRAYQQRRAEERSQQLTRLGLGEAFTPVEHHTAHAAAAYYTAPDRRGPLLVLTCDGSGDRLSATVSIGREGKLTRIAEVSEHDSIGRLYSLVTRYLGMVPLEHEYKVMGLAPYAAGSRTAQQIADSLCGLFEFPARAPLTWKRRKGVPSMYAAYGMLARLFAGQRFDLIAAGAQLFIERMLTAWVDRAIAETGIRRLACAGGVFMNVKANLSLLGLDSVEEMWVLPSCGDESNSIGAACWQAALAGEQVSPLAAIYFGEAITDAEAQSALDDASRAGARLRYTWQRDIARTTAEALAAGKIVARCAGPVEFGARALGNRSILARADSPDAVRTINAAIKNRDFWMPFAPSVLAHRAGRYYEKPKPADSPYMMFAFRSRPETRGVFGAAQHPYDFTTRAHEVTEAHNPEYFRLLSEYESITGEAIVLNTSFNLHGEPIVYRAAEAIDVLLRSGLEHLALGNFWVEKQA